MADQEQTVALFPPWALKVPSVMRHSREIAEEACTNTPIKSLQTLSAGSSLHSYFSKLRLLRRLTLN